MAWGDDGYHQNEVPIGLTNVIAIADGVDHCLAIVAIPPQFVLSNPQWQNGVFTAAVPTQAGKSYQLQFKRALSDTAWSSLPPVAGTGSILTLIDPSASSTQRFYRVSQQ